MIVRCLNCGENFQTCPARIKAGKGKFCSRKCYRGESEAERICCVCEKKFYVKPYTVRRGQGNFCSRKCMGIWNSENMRGERSHNWKDGRTPIETRVRHSPKNDKWRQEVLLRDNRTCLECRQHGGAIETHHKKLFAVLLKEAVKAMPLLDPYGACMNYAPLWDISNGQTLCEACHKKTKSYLRKT